MIDSVSVRPLEVPMARPMVLAGGAMASVPVVLIDLRTTDGIVGRSYLRTYTPLALRSLAALVEDLAALDEVPHTLRLLGLRGLVGAALAGLDMARWDARAQAAGVPLARALGATVDRVPAYASLRSRSVEDAVEEASGWRAVKLKLGGRPPDEDARVVAAVRGVAETVMGDYNQSLTVEEALRLDPLGLDWIEEPVRAHDLAAHRAVAEVLETPIQLGENLEGPAEARACLAAGASDLIMFDAMKIGGVTGWMEAAASCALPISSHTFPEFSVHLLAATPTGHWLEYLDHLAPILERPLEVRDGFAHVPSEPGVGLHWDERAIARLRR